MYTEKTKIDKIEIINFNVLQIKRTLTIYKNDMIISSTSIRSLYTKNDDISKEDEKVKLIANLIWSLDNLENDNSTIDFFNKNVLKLTSDES